MWPRAPLGELWRVPRNDACIGSASSSGCVWPLGSAIKAGTIRLVLHRCMKERLRFSFSVSMSSSSSSSSEMTMISTGLTEVGPSQMSTMIPVAGTSSGPNVLVAPPAVLPLAAAVLPPVGGGQLPAVPAHAPTEIIDISDDEGEVNWDLLEREAEEEEAAAAKAKAAKAEATVAPARGGDSKEEGTEVASSPSSSSSSSSSEDSGIGGPGYCINFHSGRPQMRRIRHHIRGPCRDP